MKRFRTILLVLLVPAAVYLTAALSGIPRAFFPALSALLISLLPIVLGGWFARRFRLRWGLFAAGVATFVASQLLHIPFNLYLLNPLIERFELDVSPHAFDLAVYGVLLGLSAGVFEEVARYLSLRFWQKNARSWGQSLMFGAGHGGIEAILIGGYSFFILVQMVMMYDKDLAAVGALAGSERAKEIFHFVATYWGASGIDYFWSFLERISAMALHLSASVLVYQSFKRKNLLWLAAAVVWHALFDALAVYGVISWGAPITEGVLFFTALLGLIMIFILREPQTDPGEVIAVEPAAPPALPQTLLPQVQINQQKLDESRYD